MFSKDEYWHIYADSGLPMETIQRFHMTTGSDLFNSIFTGIDLYARIAKQYKLKEKDYAFCFELENAGDIVPVFEGNKYREYISKYGIPYAHKETNRGKIIYLKNYPLVSFQSLAYSLISDQIGAAFGFRSDCMFDILQDSNKKYINR